MQIWNQNDIDMVASEFTINLKVTLCKLSILSTALGCCIDNFSQVFKETLPWFPWHWSTCCYALLNWDGFRHTQHSAQAYVFSWTWAINYIARNTIIIIGCKALNMKNHKVRAIASCFRALWLLVLLLMKIKGYTLSLLKPSKSWFCRSGSLWLEQPEHVRKRHLVHESWACTGDRNFFTGTTAAWKRRTGTGSLQWPSRKARC